VDKVLLDLTNKKDLLLAPAAVAFNDFVYSLEVSGNDGYSNVHPVFFQ
jgi:hypothetical protein